MNEQTPLIQLRDVDQSDLPTFFEYHRDPQANYMAAFTARDANDRAAFDAHWDRILADDSTLNKAIEVDGRLAGSIASFIMEGDLEVTYWIGRSFWGQGIATEALAQFLQLQQTRPVFGRVATDNSGSRRVLEKNGFVVVGSDRGFASARGKEIDEYVLRLD